MFVEFIIPTYDRIDPLRSMLSSLVAQTNGDWGAHVVVDRKEDPRIEELIKSIGSDKITYSFTGYQFNDWGHTPRQIGKQVSTADYIIMTGDDNYYTPNFVQELKNAAVGNPGLVYWNMVHSHYGYSLLDCQLAVNYIDMGAFATRRDIAQQINLGLSFAADGEFIKDVLTRYPSENFVKINRILFVHN